MQIKDLFEKDIDRSINGVVKVAQDDEALIKQELSEYVITTELSRHFADFFESYTQAIDVPTDKIGVWITGFFGSGKSHFLKMLSYLLSNRVVDGNAAIDYFDGKVEDPMVFSQMKRAASIPTESILFNIDSKASQWKEGDTARTALLRGFARVFYEHRGFYGQDFKLARLEEFVNSQGKTNEFRETFARVNGGNWLEDRESYSFYEDDIVEVLGEVLGMSEESARRFFENDSDDAIAPDALAAEIRKYVDAKAEANGGNFRLVFAVDEIGQFIGEDTNLMLNLQTLVEELGAQCKGRVWVIVTSQEAIDKVVKVQGDDFSKIQGRFNTRLTLSSSSVDEVIKKRVLEKKPDMKGLLENEYDKQSAVLKNLFAFENSQSDLYGYAGPKDFQAAYPFVAYQFKLMPKVFSEIRRHGNAGKHLASGERSMLSGFQESAQKIEHYDINALIPFWHFYDTLAKSLDHEIRQVIDRAEKATHEGLGLEAQDVNVLKTLYLIHYIKDVTPTINNITILMIDAIDIDKITLRDKVKASLDRLIRENYIARYGDTYSFLTDEEQDIEREIKSTEIDVSSILERIKRIVFDGIYTKKKYRLGQSDFSFDAYVDNTLHGIQSNGMKLNIITAANELSQADPTEASLQSSGQALAILRTDEDYYEVLENSAKIEKYVRTQNVSQLPESKQNIIKSKQREAASADKEAREMIENALVGADIFIDSRAVDIVAGKAEAKLDATLRELTSVVYTKAEYVGAPVEGDADIKQILLGKGQLIGSANDRALEEIMRFLDVQSRTHQTSSFGDICRKYSQVPYGWREKDIAALVGRLLADQKIDMERAGNAISAHDPAALSALTSGKERDSVKIRKHESIGEEMLFPARKLLKDLRRIQTAPESESELVEAIRNYLDDTTNTLNSLIETEYKKTDYPGRDVVSNGITIMRDILANEQDYHALIREFNRHSDDLLDFAEDFEDIRDFFPNQKRLFDKAIDLQNIMKTEAVYLPKESEALADLTKLTDILSMPRPYSRIKDLRKLMDSIASEHSKALNSKRNDVLDRIEAAKASIADYAEGKPAASALVAEAENKLISKKDAASEAKTIVDLEALTNQISTIRDSQMVAIDDSFEASKTPTNPAEELKLEIPASQPDQANQKSQEAQASKTTSPTKQIKTIRRGDVCPSTKLSSPEDVDNYVASFKKQLMNALYEYGVIRLGD